MVPVKDVKLDADFLKYERGSLFYRGVLKGQSQEVEEERNSKDFNGNYSITFKGFRYILPDLNILFL